MKKLQYISLICLLAFVVSCHKNSEKAATTPHAIKRIDQVIRGYRALEPYERVRIINTKDSLLSAYFEVIGAGQLSDSTLCALPSSRMVRMFQPAVDSIFGDLEPEERQLGNILERGRAQGLELDVKDYATVVWGLPQSMIFNHDILMVALNHYLGEKHEAYNGLPEYLRQTKTRKHIPYDMAEALVATRYALAPDATTVLARMLYDGALTYAKMELLDDADLATALGYTETELAEVMAHENFIWERLVKDDMIHSSDPTVKSMLFDPAPVTSIISPDAPGRVARYVGYRIVEAYVATHPETSLGDLFKPEFYNAPDVLQASGYTPQSHR